VCLRPRVYTAAEFRSSTILSLPSPDAANSVVQNSPWGHNSRSTSLEVPRLYEDQEFQCSVHGRFPLVPSLSQNNPVHNLTPYFVPRYILVHFFFSWANSLMRLLFCLNMLGCLPFQLLDSQTRCECHAIGCNLEPFCLTSHNVYQKHGAGSNLWLASDTSGKYFRRFDCVRNVGASTSHNRMGLHSLLEG
jgi:hypothetical protein